MSIKGWKTILGLERGREQNLTDSDRMNIIISQLETWLTMNCFYRPWHSKKCRCLACLHSPLTEAGVPSDEGVVALKFAVTSYIHICLLYQK